MQILRQIIIQPLVMLLWATIAQEDYNTGIGRAALFGNTTASNNSRYWVIMLYYQTHTGTNLTAVGYNFSLRC